MEAAFDEALVVGWEHLDGTFGLPDPNDEHVVAAAAVGNANVLVTDNMKDFPSRALPGSLRLLCARDFAETVTTLDPAGTTRSLHEIARRHRLPARTPTALLSTLVERYQWHAIGDLVTPYLSEPKDGLHQPEMH